MDAVIPRFCWKHLLGYYAVAIILCVLGSYFAYNGPLSSNAWQCWSGTQAWIRDGIRATVVAILSVFALTQMQVIGDDQLAAILRLRALLPVDNLERFLFLLPAVPLFSLIFLGTSFKQELQFHRACFRVSITNEMRQIWIPYVPYILYVLGLWVLIVFPVLIVLIRWIKKDIVHRREVISQMIGSFPSLAPEDGELNSHAFELMALSFQAYVVWLKEISERYISLIILVSLGLLYEQLTSSRLTTTTQSLDWAKVALWSLLGPSLLVLIMFVALGYQRSARRVHSIYGRFASGLVILGGESALFDRVMKERASLIWERGPTDFILSVLKSATVAVPLFVALVAYVLPAITGGNWVEIFLPKSFLDLIKHFYTG